MDVGSIWTTEKIRFRPVKECMSSLFFLIPLLLIRNLCYFAHGLFAETYFECTEVLAVLLKQSIFDGAVSMSHLSHLRRPSKNQYIMDQESQKF